MVTGGGPYYSSLADMDFAEARDIDEYLMLASRSPARRGPDASAAGTMLFIGGTGGRQAGVGLTLISAMTAALPPLIASLALELAPIRVNLIAAGFVDTPLSASLLGDQLEPRRASFAPRSPSAESSDRLMSPLSRCTS